MIAKNMQIFCGSRRLGRIEEQERHGGTKRKPDDKINYLPLFIIILAHNRFGLFVFFYASEA